MFRRIQIVLACLLALLGASSASAVGQTSTEATTGLSGNGPAIILFSIAGALLITLVFRSTATHIAGLITVKIGTIRVRRILQRRSKDVLDDFLLPGAYGGLTRIDHAILTSGGILCIQTKHYNGLIFGDADEPQWTNVDGTVRRRFLNPLIQNTGRNRALQNVVPDVPVANLVVFTGDIQFTTRPEKNVIQVKSLDSYIAKFEFGPCKIDDWDAVWMSLKAASLTDAESRRDFSAQLSFS